MLLTDKEIKILAAEGLMKKYLPENINIISYDLRANYYCFTENNNNKKVHTYALKPGESVFVQCIEEIQLPDNIAARVHLRNSRIRQGLLLEAPIYYPGHKTVVFFRVTNVSNSLIRLKPDDGIASLTFEKLESVPETVYEGTFQDEIDFTGMAGYTALFEADMEELNQKADNIKNIERNIYANVITVMTIFIGLFSLINVNVSLVSSQLITSSKLIIFNLTTVGSVAFLAAVLRTFFPGSGKKNWCVWVISVLAFAVAVGLQVFSSWEF